VKDEFGNAFTSRDCINIEKQLGYTYAPGSLDVRPKMRSAPSAKKLTVRGIDRALFQGSFVIRAFATVKNDKGESIRYYLGHHSVLNRRNAVTCANCLTHLEVVAHFSLHAMPEDAVGKAEYSITIQQRGAKTPPKLSYHIQITD
jgi:tyrosinase